MCTWTCCFPHFLFIRIQVYLKHVCKWHQCDQLRCNLVTWLFMAPMGISKQILKLCLKTFYILRGISVPLIIPSQIIWVVLEDNICLSNLFQMWRKSQRRKGSKGGEIGVGGARGGCVRGLATRYKNIRWKTIASPYWYQWKTFAKTIY